MVRFDKMKNYGIIQRKDPHKYKQDSRKLMCNGMNIRISHTKGKSCWECGKKYELDIKAGERVLFKVGWDTVSLRLTAWNVRKANGSGFAKIWPQCWCHMPGNGNGYGGNNTNGGYGGNNTNGGYCGNSTNGGNGGNGANNNNNNTPGGSYNDNDWQ